MSQVGVLFISVIALAKDPRDFSFDANAPRLYANPQSDSATAFTASSLAAAQLAIVGVRSLTPHESHVKQPIVFSLDASPSEL